MSDITIVMVAMAVATFGVRLGGVLAGRLLPREGAWAAALEALPGCLIVSLVTVTMIGGGPQEWAAGAVTLAVAVLTKNLPLTMIAGVGAIYLLRMFG